MDSNDDKLTANVLADKPESNQSSHSLKSLVSGLIFSLTSSPLNTFLALICVVIAYFVYRDRRQNDQQDSQSSEIKPRLEPFPKGDLTLEELRKYDGIKSKDGRVLLSINREVYDVTKGSRFYGPEGPYAALAGRDATRALASFQLDSVKDTWDDHSDLSSSQMGTVTEWIEQFKEKYDYIGKLVKTEAEKSTPVDAADEEPDEEDVTLGTETTTTGGDNKAVDNHTSDDGENADRQSRKSISSANVVDASQ